MTMDQFDLRLSEAVAEYVERQLIEDFPNWRIHRQDTGHWTATHPIYGPVHADNPSQLYVRLDAAESGKPGDENPALPRGE
jgi:hypothetical protein